MLLKLTRYYWRPFLAIVLIFTIVGLSFVYAMQTSEAMRIQTVQELDQQWRTDYDLLVSPTQEQMEDEPEQKLVRRSDMANHLGGISIEQYEQIKAMEGIEVAAPISFMGYIESGKVSSDFRVPEEGLYHVEIKDESFDGIRYRNIPHESSIDGYIKSIEGVTVLLENPREREVFVAYQDPKLKDIRVAELFSEIGWINAGVQMTQYRIEIPFRGNYFWSLIAVDPEAEDKLLNLSGALVEGEYIPIQESLHMYQGYPRFPILLQQKSFDVKRTVKIDQILDPTLLTYMRDPLQYKDELLTFMEQYDIKELLKKSLFEQEYEPYSEEYLYFDGVVKVEDGKLVKQPFVVVSTKNNPKIYELSELQHERRGELEGHPLYQAIPVGSSEEQIHYRTLEGRIEEKGFGYDLYGVFDPSLLKNPYSTSSAQKSPDFYNPDSVYITHDTEGNPLPERVEYQNPPSKEAYSTGGVDAITTLAAAEYLLGDKPISIIRVVVEGAGERSEESMAKVERIAEQIRQETGLHVDVMLGAADRKVQVFLDDFESVPGYGYLLEGWSQASSSFILEERVNNTNLLLSGYIFLIGLTGVFLVYRNYAEIRRKDLVIQYTFGWKKSRIYRQLIQESGITLLVVIVLLLLSKFTFGRLWTWEQFGLGLGVLLMVMLISIGCFYVFPVTKGLEQQVHLRGNTQQILSLRTAAPATSLWGYFWHTLIRNGFRSLVKLGILLATVIYVFVFLLTKGSSSNFLMLTFMGENIDLMLESYQWVLFGLGVLLSLGSYVAILINQMEKRTQEIQLFQAWGWSSRKWIQMYLLEEVCIAMAALVIGIGTGYGVLSMLTSAQGLVTLTSVFILSCTLLVVTLGIVCVILVTRSTHNRLREFN